MSNIPVFSGSRYQRTNRQVLTIAPTIETEEDTWYSDLVSEKDVIMTSPIKIVSLRQSDFKNGTVIISKDYYVHSDSDGVSQKVSGSTSGFIFRLEEDIKFDPNLPEPNEEGVWTGSSPKPGQFTHAGGVYDTAAYGIGFFAAIALSAKNVVLDLNGHTLEQGDSHYLLQRFYANIELGSSPFIPSQGPHNFGNTFEIADGCYIINGHIGQSSHHGIHGNKCTKVLLDNVSFKKYEIAAVHMNAASYTYVNKVNVLGNCTTCPVFGTFSAARFLIPYLDKLASSNPGFTIRIFGANVGVTTIRNRLKTAMFNVYKDVVIDKAITGGFIRDTRKGSGTHNEWGVFHNFNSRTDGNQYGMAFHSTGVAVHGFLNVRPSEFTSDHIFIKDVIIQDNHAIVNEIPSLAGKHDSVGAVFQIQNVDGNGDLVTLKTNGEYTGNVVSDAQAIVAKGIKEGVNFSPLSTKRNDIGDEILKLVSGEKTAHTLDISYRYNSDTMNHVNKGVIGLRVDGTRNLTAKDVIIRRTTNNGKLGLTNATLPVPISKPDEKSYICKIGNSIPKASLPGYNGSHTRGVVLSACEKCVFENMTILDAESSYGYSYGVDIQFNTRNVNILNTQVAKIKGGTHISESDLILLEKNPTPDPVAIGVRIDKSCTNIRGNKNTILDSTFTSPLRSTAVLMETLSASI
jgi:hypothetical protein